MVRWGNNRFLLETPHPMTKFDFSRIFGTGIPAKSQKHKRGRTCQIEELEGREMLSVSPWTLTDDAMYTEPQPADYTAIFSQSDDCGYVNTAPTNASLTPKSDALPSGPITQAEYEKIRKDYADLNFNEDIRWYNIHVFNADQLTEGNLRGAIAQAESSGRHDIIVFKTTATQNTIKLSSELYIYGGSGGVSIVSLGSGTGVTNLTLDAQNHSRVINIGSNGYVQLAGLTIKNGKLTDDNGAGIYITGGVVNITKCTITANKIEKVAVYVSGMPAPAPSYGGGICMWGGTVKITESTISANEITGDGYGGGWGGGIYNASTATFTKCTITGNKTKTYGGGICTEGPRVLTLTSCTVSENEAGYMGGGISSQKASPVIQNCTIAGNSAGTFPAVNHGSLFTYIYSLGSGGGIDFFGGTPTVINSVIAGNRTAGQGAGICINGDSKPTLRNCTVAGNTAYVNYYMDSYSYWVDGYLYYYSGTVNYANSGTVTYTNYTYQYYEYTNNGYNYVDYTGKAGLAQQGGGIYVGKGTLSLYNSIVAKNQTAYAENVYNYFFTYLNLTPQALISHDIYESPWGRIVGDYNLIGDGRGQKSLNGANNRVNVDPQFLQFTPLAYSGGLTSSLTGPAHYYYGSLYYRHTWYNVTGWTNTLWKTWDLRLKMGSPGHDTGSMNLASGTTDVDNKPRAMGLTVDRGAHEWYMILDVAQIAAGSGVATSSSVQFQWYPVAHAAGFTIQYATDAAFTKNAGTKKIEGKAYADLIELGNLVAEVTGLDADTVYYFRIRAEGIYPTTNSAYSSSIMLKTDAAATATPTGLTVTETKQMSASVSWDAGSGATGYDVQYRVADGDWITVNAKYISGTTATVNNLMSSSEYEFRVRARGVDNSAWLGGVSTETLEFLNLPLFWGEMTSKSISFMPLNLPPEVKASDLTLYYSVSGSDKWTAGAKIKADGTMKQDKLKAATNYDFELRDKDGNMVAVLSQVRTFADKAVKPTGIKVTDSTLTSITISWKHSAKNDPNGYMVYCMDWEIFDLYGTYPEFSKVVVSADGKTASVTISNLPEKAKQSYKISIEPVNLDWQSSYKPAIFTVKTGVYTAVKIAKINKSKDVGFDSVVLHWGEGMSGTDGYLIKVYDVKAKKYIGEPILVEPDTPMFRIDGLTPGKKYRIEVQAGSGDMEDNPTLSAVAKIKVKTKKYAAPKKDGKVQQSAGQVAFSWKASTGKDIPAGAKTYEVGIFVDKTVGYVFFGTAEFDARFAGVNVVIVGQSVTITGLNSQKYTFGLKEVTTVEVDAVDAIGYSVNSAIAKIKANLTKF